MGKLLSSYLRTYDTATFLTQAGAGYVRTKCTTARFGPLPNVRGSVKFRVRGEATFGQGFTALGDMATVRIAVAEGGRLTVGDNVAMNSGSSIEVWHEVSIGDKVMMGPNVTIMDDNRHEVEPGAPLWKGPTVIGDNVWLAASVTVLPGVTIGSGSVIGGNSVVSQDIPANSFAAGSPARVVKQLNVPDGWSHRYGYERNEPASGIVASLRRAFGGDPNAEIARADQGPGGEAQAGRDHEVVG
jgi:acetyltransferase-like isoleucine patch superfamily enzyme